MIFCAMFLLLENILLCFLLAVTVVIQHVFWPFISLNYTNTIKWSDKMNIQCANDSRLNMFNTIKIKNSRIKTDK